MNEKQPPANQKQDEYRLAVLRNQTNMTHSVLQNTTSTLTINNNHSWPVLHPNATHYVDITPSYFLYSGRLPPYITCVVPWVKLVVLLRQPVQRAYSHYHMWARTQRADRRTIDEKDDETVTPIPTVHAWIAKDVQALWQYGVLQEAAAVAATSTTRHEQPANTTTRLDQAWQRYTSTLHDHVVGRGLYAISLQHWWTAMDAAHKPRQDLLVISSQDFLHHRDDTYRRILQHLQLPYEAPHPDNAHVQSYHDDDDDNDDDTNNNGTATTANHTFMPVHLQRLLQDLYRPFDWQLRQLLRNNYGESSVAKT